MNMTGAELITAERERQIKEEGWTAEHDDEHIEGELALLACCYASPVLLYREKRYPKGIFFEDPYPDSWLVIWDKRVRNGDTIIPNCKIPTKTYIRQLVKAGALIAAEIDRLQRLK
jgi:hypothetical protein